MLPISSVVLPGLSTYIWSFVLYTGFPSNPAFSIHFFLPSNHWTIKPLPISLISSSCIFHLANSGCLPIFNFFVFHPLTSSLLVDAPLLWNNLPDSVPHSSSIASFKSALKTHLFSSGLWMPCLCVCVCVWVRAHMHVCMYACVCVHVCVGSDKKDVEWSVVMGLCT